MTCGFCKYEFCWACGGSATTAENHFGNFRGCGVRMMDENVKPGDHLKIRRINIRVWRILEWAAVVIFLPLILLAFYPYTMTENSLRYTEGFHPITRVL